MIFDNVATILAPLRGYYYRLYNHSLTSYTANRYYKLVQHKDTEATK